jgi:Lysine efflux permease
MVAAFIHGLVLALGLILPLGVQNLFVFQQGVVQPRFVSVLPAILAAALCDTLLILLSVSGAAAVLVHFAVLKNILMTAGILFLFYMGYANWHARSLAADAAVPVFSPRQQIVFATSVSLLNPAAFLDIIGVIGTSSLQYEAQAKLMFTVATILVSWLWFCGLGLLGGYLGSLQNVSDKLQTVNKIASLFIWGTAFYLGMKFLV